MSDKQLHTFWVTASSYLQAPFTSQHIDEFISALQEAIQPFQESLSADNLLVLAKLYAVQQVLRDQLRHIDLRVLVTLGRTPEAFAIAHFNANPMSKFYGLATIFDALAEKERANTDLFGSPQEVVIGSKRARIWAL
jgi:hypothetical protein